MSSNIFHEEKPFNINFVLSELFRHEIMENPDRFNHTKTPMGTVPISVIYGFKYPLSPGGTGSQTCSTQTSPLMKSNTEYGLNHLIIVSSLTEYKN